jgi:hypothetical protein
MKLPDPSAPHLIAPAIVERGITERVYQRFAITAPGGGRHLTVARAGGDGSQSPPAATAA